MAQIYVDYILESALCYAPAAHIGHCKMFRNYRSPQQATSDATLVQALRASWATPGVVSSIFVGRKGLEEELVSAVNGFANPTQEAIKEAYSIFGPDTRIACILSLGSGQRGVISLGEDNDSLQDLGTRMITEGDNMAEEVRKRIGRLRVYYRFSVDRGLEVWDMQRQGFGMIKSHVDAYLSKDVVNANLEECLSVSKKARNITMERVCEFLFSKNQRSRA